jgi:uncharacterized OB-fold protein
MTLPVPDEVSQPFWDACAAGELRMQACASCGRLRFPPRPMCPRCRSMAVEWPVMSGLGTVWSFAVPHPPLLPAYAEVAPYNVVVVQLDEDPTLRLVGNVVATPNGPLNEVDPHSIEIGERVRVVFADPTDGISMPRWVRAQ